MSAKKMAVTVAVVCVLVMAIFLLKPGISTNAQAPAGTRTVSYTGQLSYSDRAAVDGAYDFIFSLYDAPEAGNLLWSEQQAGIAVRDGKFSTDLGVATPFPASLFENQGMWLEVSLRGPGEADFTTLTPRQNFTPLAADVLTCPHDHYGASWSGTGAIDAIYLYNSSVGDYDGLHVISNNTSTNTGAVYARNIATTGNGDAINTSSSRGVGLRAFSGLIDGIDATTSGTGWSAIYGHATNSYGVTGASTNRFGVQARGGGDASGDDWLGDLWLDGDRGEILTTSKFNLQSNWNVNVTIDHNNDQTDARFRVWSDIAHEVFSVDELGNVYADGAWMPYLSTDNYGERQLYGMAATEARFEDFGSAILQKGVVTVAFDPIFAETINTNLDYQVFLTPVCQEAVVLFVTTKTPAGFTVQGVTLSNEPSNCSFDYRITAKRLGYETYRLDQNSTTSDASTH